MEFSCSADALERHYYDQCKFIFCNARLGYDYWSHLQGILFIMINLKETYSKHIAMISVVFSKNFVWDSTRK